MVTAPGSGFRGASGSATATKTVTVIPARTAPSGGGLVSDDHAGFRVPCRPLARDQLQLQRSHPRILLRGLEGLADEVRHALRLRGKLRGAPRRDLRRRQRGCSGLCLRRRERAAHGEQDANNERGEASAIGG